MKFSNWLLSEGKWDWETTQIIRKLMSKIKEKMNNIRAEKAPTLFCVGTGLFNPGSAVDMEKYCHYIEIPIEGLNMLVMVQKSDRVKSSGGFKYPDYILIELHVPYDFNETHLEDVRRELIGTIRHELEHRNQPEDDYQSAKAANEPKNQSLEQHVAYYTHPAEASAFVMQLYKFAKTSKRPFEEVVDEYLEKVLQAILYKFPDRGLIDVQNAKQQIKSNWMDYAKQRLSV